MKANELSAAPIETTQAMSNKVEIAELIKKQRVSSARVADVVDDSVGWRGGV